MPLLYNLGMCGCMPQSNNSSRRNGVNKEYKQLQELEYIQIEDTYISSRQFRAKLKQAKSSKSEPNSY